MSRAKTEVPSGLKRKFVSDCIKKQVSKKWVEDTWADITNHRHGKYKFEYDRVMSGSRFFRYRMAFPRTPLLVDGEDAGEDFIKFYAARTEEQMSLMLWNGYMMWFTPTTCKPFVKDMKRVGVECGKRFSKHDIRYSGQKFYAIHIQDGNGACPFALNWFKFEVDGGLYKDGMVVYFFDRVNRDRVYEYMLKP
jgi:hypothetical protein